MCQCVATSYNSCYEGKRPRASRDPHDALCLGLGWKAVEDVFEVIFLIGPQNRAGLHQERRRREAGVGGGGWPVSCSGEKEPSRHRGAVGRPERRVMGVRTWKEPDVVGPGNWHSRSTYPRATGGQLRVFRMVTDSWSSFSLRFGRFPPS